MWQLAVFLWWTSCQELRDRFTCPEKTRSQAAPASLFRQVCVMLRSIVCGAGSLSVFKCKVQYMYCTYLQVLYVCMSRYFGQGMLVVSITACQEWQTATPIGMSKMRS